MRPDFTKVEFKPEVTSEPTLSLGDKGGAPAMSEWLTAEHIPVLPYYTREVLDGMEHLEYAAGIPPYLRGPYSTMYAMQPWTIRQYAGYSTAEESNAFYRRNLAAG
jgi:methylmalonyl-CoA mutase